MEVRSAIQQIALEHRRRYGYRRITAELHRRGMQVNHKRVARIMREDNLLGMQPARFVVTTNSNHKLEIYLNLDSRMKLTGINQLWVADIAYIRLKAEFVYLAVILDGFSRKVVGLGTGSNFGNSTDDRSAGASHPEPTPGTWLGAPLGSRITIRLGRIRKSP
jgi:putative transposase